MEVKNLYFENYKTSMEKIEEDKTSGKIHWARSMANGTEE